MISLILTIFGTLIVTFFIWCYEKKFKFRSLKDVPGPKPYPIIGNIFEFGFNPYDQLKNLMRLSTTYQSIIKVWIGPSRVYVIITDPKFTELILNSPKYIKKGLDYSTFQPWLGNGLLLSYGSYWQKRRKILTPAFHFRILEGFVGIFNEQTNILIERLSKNVNKVFDVYPFITDCTLDVICETAMGSSVKAQSTEDNDYVNAVHIFCTTIVNRTFSWWKRSDLLFSLTNEYKMQQKALKVLHGYSRSVIEQRRQKLENEKELDSNIDDMGIKKRQVFLDILLKSNIDGKPLSNADIQEEVDTFMFEGHDTTASLIAYAMFALGHNPEIQDKMFSEVRQIFGDDKNYQPTLQDFGDMKYTELVLKETLRLYPSVPYMARCLEEDVYYKGTRYPKDTTMMIFIFGMQRREDLFPNADKFNPDRFLDKNCTENPFQYVPFSAGPRNCIGQKFAMYEAKCAISKLIMNFEILPVDSVHDLQLSSEAILKSINGVHVELKHRQIKK